MKRRIEQFACLRVIKASEQSFHRIGNRNESKQVKFEREIMRNKNRRTRDDFDSRMVLIFEKVFGCIKLR